MGILDAIDRQKCLDLAIGVIGINFTFVMSGVLFEWMTKLPYKHFQTSQQAYFRSAVGLIAIERGVVWILAEIWNLFTIPKNQKTNIPKKNGAICGFIIFFSSITNTQAIYMVSFPLTIMVKSCNILSVILVGVLCSRVTHKQLKLGPKKLLVAVVVSVGIVMFRFFDPEANFSEGRNTELFGLFLLLLSLLSDGFLPDFQAEIKEKYKPLPTEMLLQINKWSCLFCIGYSIIIGHFFYTLSFCYNYPLFIIHLVSMSVLTFFGQIFVYRMIKQFKQHIVPFVVTTRKVITVSFSLIYFHHKSSVPQIFGIVLVFLVTLYEFLSQILKEKQPTHEAIASEQHIDSIKQDKEEQQTVELKSRQKQPLQTLGLENTRAQKKTST